MVELVARDGYQSVSLPALLSLADVDAAEFDRCYGDLGDCFAAVWKRCQEEVVTATAAAYQRGEGWLDGMRAAAWELCRWTDSNRDRSRILFVELAFAPERVRAVRDLTFRAYAALIHAGNDARPGAEVPRDTAEALMGAIWERLVNLVGGDRFEDLPRQVPEMMYVLVLPYLGPEAAAAELRRGPEDVAAFERGRRHVRVGDEERVAGEGESAADVSQKL